MDNAYTYDAVSNVLSVVNGASIPQSGKAGGQMAHTNTYGTDTGKNFQLANVKDVIYRKLDLSVWQWKFLNYW